MVVKVSQEVGKIIDQLLSGEVCKGRILECASRNEHSEPRYQCLNSDNLPLETLFKALYEGYEIEKPEYTEVNLSRHFKFINDNEEYTAKYSNGSYMILWLTGDGHMTGTIYSVSEVLIALNSSNWVITKIIK